jgi:hypothetical protein
MLYRVHLAVIQAKDALPVEVCTNISFSILYGKSKFSEASLEQGVLDTTT